MTAKSDIDRRFLMDSPLFVGLEEAEVERLVELARVREYGDGEVIVSEGTVGDSLFLLCAGTIAVGTLDRAGRVVDLASLEERGAFFGEIGLVDPGPRSATVKAAGEATLLELTLESLESFFASFPETRVVILRNIARVLARRLRDSNVRVAAASAS